MKAYWLKLAARYDALVSRERWLIALASIGGIVLLGYSLAIEPARHNALLAERNAVEYSGQLANVRAQMVALQSPAKHPDVAARAELDGLKRQLADLAGRLELMEGSLVPPQQMSGLLEDMIGRRSGLRLLALKTLPVTPLLEKKAGADEKDATKIEAKKPEGVPVNTSGGLFKHGVEIRLEGSYQELAAYLERLEQAKLKLLWSGVELSADKHPKLVLTLTVYTLSLDRAWLIV